VVSADDIDEPKAFFPPPPAAEDPGGWPPPTRAVAKARAREARMRERGLAVDDAALERVADVIVDPAYEDVGFYYTAEELDDELPIGLPEVVDEYLAARPAINGGVEFGWRDGRQTLFVGIVGDLEPHRAPLAEMGGDRVVLETRARTVGELEAIAERLAADVPELAAADLEVEPRCILPCPGRGVVRVLVVGGSDERAVADLFVARYGPAVEVMWLGPSRLREVPRAFGSWTGEGRRVRVFFGIDHNGEQRGNARVVEETGERVVIEVTCLEPVGMVTLIGGFQPLHADLELRDPVGDRAVIDASAGVARPSLAQLGVRARRRARPPERRVVDPPPPVDRRPAQVWFSATDGEAVYDAMLPAGDPPLDEHGDPVVRPAVRRAVLEAICRDIAATAHAPARGVVATWVDDALIVEGGATDEDVLTPGPDGLYEVARLARLIGACEWVEIETHLPDGPIDADTAVDLLERVQKGYPTLGLILRRLDLHALRGALPRVTRVAVRDAVEDEIVGRSHGFGARLFRSYLRELERGTSDDRGWHAYYMQQQVDPGEPEAILRLVPDAGERVLALLRAEDDPEARAELADALSRLGHRPAIPELIALLDDPYRDVRTRAARALGALRAHEATSALQRMLTTERGRTDPPPPIQRSPRRTDQEAARDVRAALLAISGRRYEAPTPPREPSR
jgi:HEAT repeats